MVLEKSTRTRGRRPLVEQSALVSLCIVVAFLAQASLAQNASITSGSSTSAAVTPMHVNDIFRQTGGVDYGQVLRDVLVSGLSKVPRSLVSKLLAADVRFECSASFLRTMRAFQNLEPWALRLMDATGKYPTGAFESSRVDMGAFDQCLETAVRDRNGNVLSRGQYCNLLIYGENATGIQAFLSLISDALHPKLRYFSKYGVPLDEPLARIAICYIDDCSQQDLQAMVAAVSVPLIRLEVSNCVTAEPRPWSKTQIAIVIWAAILLAAIIMSTLVDSFVGQESEWRKKHGFLFQAAMAFSAIRNTRTLAHVAGKGEVEQRSLQFFHGLRCLVIMHIVLGHIHAVMADSFSRLLSLFEETARWEAVMVSAAFNGVDTFFFLSGFFLCHTISKQNGHGAGVFITAVIRRLIRISIPFFFVIMWFYLLPRFVNGPDTETFYQRFYVDVSEHWWMWLLQIRNVFEIKRTRILEHSWYLSADFQLFIVSLLTLLTFRRRKAVTLAAFAVLSLLGCAIATWTKARWHLLPFFIMPFPHYTRAKNTLDYYYILPFYHAVCYFSGCMTSLILADFRERKISKTLQLAGWCLSVCCGLVCVFIKLPWYSTENPTSESVEIIVAFFDRILWSICLTWITLACSTGRGGPVNWFLSWNAFVPLSKLSYGVYLIHMPFMELLLFSSRERISFTPTSRVTFFFALLVWCFMLSYFAFVACEAPTAALDKLVFGRLMRGGGSQRQEGPGQLQNGDMKTSSSCGKSSEISRC